MPSRSRASSSRFGNLHEAPSRIEQSLPKDDVGAEASRIRETRTWAEGIRAATEARANAWSGIVPEINESLAKTGRGLLAIEETCKKAPKPAFCNSIKDVLSAEVDFNDTAKAGAFYKMAAERFSAESKRTIPKPHQKLLADSSLAMTGYLRGLDKFMKLSFPDFPKGDAWKAVYGQCEGTGESREAWVKRDAPLRQQTYIVRGPSLVVYATGSPFGSGFPMVYRGKTGNVAQIVTNFHVVRDMAEVQVFAEDGKKLGNARITLQDPHVDLALLELEGEPLGGGIMPAAAVPKDLDPVTATGYPALGGAPSFQTTRGAVSNERYSGGLLIQHTAPIDPGSSGGPLTGGNNELMGVNTFLAAQRQGAAFAVPTAAVARMFRTVEARRASPLTATGYRELARDACLEVVDGILAAQSAEAGEDHDAEVAAGKNAIAARIAKSWVRSSSEYIEKSAPKLRDQYPGGLEVRQMIANFVVDESALAGEVLALETCGKLAAETAERQFTFVLPMTRGEARPTFAYEAGVFTLADFSVVTSTQAVAAPKAK
jgi:S1-C subfamily serine protease